MEIQQFLQSFCAGDGLPSGAFISHSRFETVVNFVNDLNQIAYITSNEILLASNAIFLPEVRLHDASSLTISPQTITLDNVIFNRDRMDIYDSSFHFEDFDLAAFESRLLQIPSQYSTLFPEKSLIFLVHAENEKFFPSGFDHQFMLNAKKGRELILSGEIIKGIETIRGTGYGLTPSGDDFIAGVLLGIHYNESKFKLDLSTLRDKIYLASIGRNLLTNSFLLNAKQRKYFSPLKKILLLLSGEINSPFRDALKQLLSIGATSGADLFSGYIFAIKHKTGI